MILDKDFLYTEGEHFTKQHFDYFVNDKLSKHEKDLLLFHYDNCKSCQGVFRQFIKDREIDLSKKYELEYKMSKKGKRGLK